MYDPRPHIESAVGALSAPSEPVHPYPDRAPAADGETAETTPAPDHGEHEWEAAEE